MTKREQSGSAAPGQPTLKTIAGLTGLAVPTISRALSGAPDISAKTRARVRQVANEIGYVPNRAGVRLRTGRTNVIALALSTEHEVMNHTAKLIGSVAAGLRTTSFHLNITPYFADEDPMKPIKYIVETRSADAVIFNQTQPEDPRVAYLQRIGFPFATHGRTVWSDAHAYYDFDNTTFGRLGVERLVHNGRRHILIVTPPLTQSYGQHILEGAQTAARSLDVNLHVLDGITSDHAMDTTEQAIRAHLAAGHPVDGVICASNSSSIAAMSVLEKAGHVIGKSVDLITKEAIPLLKRIRPEVITIKEDIEATGTFLARAAMAAVLDPAAPPLQFLEVPQLAP